MTAETLYPSKIAFIGRCDFLKFLDRHPETYQSVTEEMSRNYALVCEQLRAVGLSHSAPARLARLLLDWSVTGQTTDHETRFRFSLTHEEIGEFIGASRETVSRILSAFRSRHLIAYHVLRLAFQTKQPWRAIPAASEGLECRIIAEHGLFRQIAHYSVSALQIVASFGTAAV